MKNASNGSSGRLFFLDLGGGRVMSANPDGSDVKTVVLEGRKLPDSGGSSSVTRNSAKPGEGPSTSDVATGRSAENSSPPVGGRSSAWTSLLRWSSRLDV